MFDIKVEKEKVKRKRKKKDDEEKAKPSRRSSTSSTTSNTDIPKKRQRKAKPKREQVISVDEDDEEDELCASKSCARPAGDEVGWVQCDSCELWFHLICIGLSSEKAEALDSFKCTLCVAPVVNISSTKESDSPESVNVDVDSTTPCANSPCADTSSNELCCSEKMEIEIKDTVEPVYKGL